jgi:hypothetical protein
MALLLSVLALTVFGAKMKPERKSPGTIDTKVQTETAKRPVTATQPPAVLSPAPAPDTPAPSTIAGAAAYDVPWQSVNAGGQPATSTNYSVHASIGQSTIGYATSTNYEAGIGYWYGMAGGGCSCPYQCDYDTDGFLTALDLGSLIDVLFAGRPEETDPDCPTSRGDFDNDGFPTALDLGRLIDHLFAGGPPPIDPCNP